MEIQRQIEATLQECFQPQYLKVLNESYQHSVPKNSETHFKVVIVSDAFTGDRSVKRHQKVYAVLSQPLKNGVHALGLHTYTPEEWKVQGNVPESPNCMGGSKRS